MLEPGRSLIEGIANLGSTLGYSVKKELPVQRRRNPPAVDVAWLGEEGQEFPLMIFEVESRASNAAAANAVKVFGQPNERFEKPLFFFHIFLAGGDDTARLEVLRNSFGSHNYRVYRLDSDDCTRLVRDILSQHRRLNKGLDLEGFIAALDAEAWTSVDLDAIFEQAEALHFDANYLPSYARLARRRPGLVKHFVRLLDQMESSPPQPHRPWEYSTYVGYHWPDAVHIGVLGLHLPSAHDHLKRLRYWQERSTYTSMIGPHFGLSRDYDEFLLGIAPAYMALIAALLYKIQDAQAYVWQLSKAVLEHLEKAPVEASFPTAIWMAHVAAAIGDESRFEVSRNFINERGGVSRDALCEPPSIVGFHEPDDEWITLLNDEKRLVPRLQEFRRDLRLHYSSVHDIDAELTELALDVLTTDDALHEWSGSIALLLHAPSGLTMARAPSSPTNAGDGLKRLELP